MTATTAALTVSTRLSNCGSSNKLLNLLIYTCQNDLRPSDASNIEHHRSSKIGCKFTAEKSAHLHEFAIFNKLFSVCIFQSQEYPRICMASMTCDLPTLVILSVGRSF